MGNHAISEVTYFRPRVPGPECRIEDAVACRLSEIFESLTWPMWVGGSVQVGCGFPDLISVWYDPKVITLASFDSSVGHILAYLRSVRRARLETIVERVGYPRQFVEDRMDCLTDSSVVTRTPEDTFAMLPAWRVILPQVVTVEAKVSDWKSALQQAIRNRIFAHRSYVALPENVGRRVMKTEGFAAHGIGVLGVDELGNVSVCREARKNSPRVWSYYFHLAAIAARDVTNRDQR